MNKYGDQKLVYLLFFLAGISIALFLAHRIAVAKEMVPETVVVGDMEREATIDKYETPEEVVEYVMYWIHQGDLDYALRGCAIEEVAEDFSLQSYMEVLDKYVGSAVLAPSDEGSSNYWQINELRMAAVYSDMIGQCIGMMGDGYDMRVLDIYSDIPENADGYYYQAIRDICSIVGARDACNVVINMEVNGVLRQMKVTVARYKNAWKVLQFSEYSNYEYVEPQIIELVGDVREGSLPYEWDEMGEHVLPLNYKLLCDNSEETVEELLEKWFWFIQRDEVYKALTYFDIYDAKKGVYLDSVLLAKQGQAALQTQNVLYKLFLYNQGSVSWIAQNPKEEAENLLTLLDTRYLFKGNLTIAEILEESEKYVKCKVTLKESATIGYEVELVYRDGWKIKSIV